MDLQFDVTSLHKAALLTKHHKLCLIAPALADAGFTLSMTEAFDTDSLGMFSGEYIRTLSPLDCVKTKARLASELTGERFGIGSEGSFGGGPLQGLLNWDDELICLFDKATEQYVVAHAAGPVPLSPIDTDQAETIRSHLEKHDEKQGWICVTSKELIKGLVGFADIYHTLQQTGLLATPTKLSESIRLLPDLRAHLCPPRQEYIRQAANQLAARLRARCPACQAPNFWRKEVKQGLPCSQCGYPTHRIQHFIHKCDCCSYSSIEIALEQFAEPTHCPLCNP